MERSGPENRMNVSRVEAGNLCCLYGGAGAERSGSRRLRERKWNGERA